MTTTDDTKDKDGEWHRWFAWKPVTVDAYSVRSLRNGRTYWTAWLRFVERRWDSDFDVPHWRYKEVDDVPDPQ